MQMRELQQIEIPEKLLEIPQPPKRLFIRGNLPNSNLKNLVIVGSRKHSNYGKQAVKDIIAGLAGYPINIVSGLALGIDTIAHEEALSHGMITTVFPGSGISDMAIHPQTNVRLANKIIENGGCIISEYDPYFKATQYSFPQRNRLMAGYADAVLIIEAEDKSGTLITARLTVEYNRDLLVVPGSIYSATSKGTNWLLSQGALAITCAKDVLQALGLTTGQEKLVRDLSDEEKVIIDILREPMTRDEIIRECEGSTNEINTLLMKMELRGIIKEDAGYFRNI